MDRRKRGKCIIFNNKEFDASTAMNSRPGSDLDAKNMYDIFRSDLQFEVELLHNQTTMEMLQRVANGRMHLAAVAVIDCESYRTEREKSPR